MSEQVTVWFVGFPWGSGPLRVRSDEGTRTEKQVRVRDYNRGGYTIHDPGTCHYTEIDAADAALDAALHRVEVVKRELATQQAQLDEVVAYRTRREQEGWS